MQLSSYFGDSTESFLYQRLSLIYLVPRQSVEILSGAIILFGSAALVNLIADKFSRKRLPPVPAVLLLGFAVLLFLPLNPIAHLQSSLWLFAPALFHGSQYLCVVAAKLCKIDCQATNPAKLTFLLKRYGQCLLFSVAIFLLVPWLLAALGRPFGLTYTVAVAAVFVGVQVNHMALDSVIWRHPAKLA